MLGFAWILIICGSLLQYCSAELKLLQAVFRHGNRAPVAPSAVYPNDPYRNYTYEPEGLGGLTNTGKLSVYKLGEFFKRQYGHFLGPIYSANIIRFRADEVERIVMTGELVAAGLFPPAKIQRWHPTLNWQPIPVWTVPLEQDFLYNGVFCTNHKQQRSMVENTDPFIQQYLKENKDFFAYLSKHAGSNITSMASFFLRQQFYAQRDLGLKLPEWTKPIFPNGKLDQAAVMDLVIQSYNHKLKQIMGGVWIREWLDHIEEFMNPTISGSLKAYMYAGHEINIAGILNALNAFNYRVPSYSSTVIFELHEINEEYYVQVLHKDKEDVRILNIPGCNGQLCLLSIFKQVLAPVVPEDPVEACGNVVLSLFS